MPIAAFIGLIFNTIKLYLFTVLPIVIVLSIICILFGMCIKAGATTGIGVLLILLTGLIFIFVVYGKDASKIFISAKDKLYNMFFNNESFKYSDKQESNDTESNEA
jgi:glucan phosphoethanolaminetransferase (alkaline phosphatase superfamily)